MTLLRHGVRSTGEGFYKWQALLLTILLLISSSSHAHLQLLLEDTDLDPLSAAHTTQLLVAAAAALPPSLVSRLDQRLMINWSRELPSDVIGRASSGNKVTLNERWLPPLPVGKHQPESLQHQEVERNIVLATLVHEIAHHYDRAQLWSAKERALLQHCQQRHKTQGNIGLPAECRGQTDRRFTVSDAPQFLDLAGWPERIGDRGKREAENHRDLRSPDAYELHSPQEFFAVNLEYFLLDPEYACRRPALFQYFQEHFDWVPAQMSHCSSALPYVNADFTEDNTALGWIDPERLYQVHYLLAEANDAWASRWGHSMLRLVMCAPGRSPGPACLLDLEHHLVLSFRAFVDDLELSSWDGLTGVYPSRLFVLPFNKVVDEYTQIELRSLSSVPLTLSAEQQHHLVTQAAEMHWSYDGTYYFVSNNCAVETLKLLRSGSQHEALRDLDSLTPNGLLQLLTARGLADTEPLQNRQQAMRQGYFFDSYSDRYRRMFEVIREQLAVPQTDFERWLAAPAEQRAQWLEYGDLRTTAALLVLEEAARRRLVQLIQQDLKQRFVSRSKQANDDLSQVGELMQQLLSGTSFLSRPGEFIRTGYGLPQPADADLSATLSEKQRGLREQSATLDARLKLLLNKRQQKELTNTDANLLTLSEQLHQLHQKAGGVVLP